jgi:hypothetical protein
VIRPGTKPGAKRGFRSIRAAPAESPQEHRRAFGSRTIAERLEARHERTHSLWVTLARFAEPVRCPGDHLVIVVVESAKQGRDVLIEDARQRARVGDSDD